MSLGYAEKLSYREDVGTVGMSEIFDLNHLLQQKIEQLALMIGESKHLVVFTGAGISTSCGIPDFRGPKGVWTLQREGKGVPEASLPFHRAMPSLTHMALVELEKRGILKFVISQNVDSLHLRSGIPREKLAELHGNSFREICPSCGVEYIRDFEVETIGLKITPRRCSDVKCNSKLRDTVLDWEDALPSTEMNAAEKHCRLADVVLCLGTSLQITPACNLPLKSLRGGGKIVIVNLQPTPKDKKASLVIHGLVDKVDLLSLKNGTLSDLLMPKKIPFSRYPHPRHRSQNVVAGVMRILNMQICPYVRVDAFQVVLYQSCSASGASAEKKYARWSLKVTSVHAERAPLPFIKSVEVTFPERPELKSAILEKQPFLLKREMLKSRPFKMVLKVNFSDGCGCPFTTIEFPVDFQKQTESISQDKDVVIQKLKDTAMQDGCCGKFSLVERKILPSLKRELAIYTGTTNVVRYSELPSGNSFADVKWGVKRERKDVNVKGKSCWRAWHDDETVKKLKVC